MKTYTIIAGINGTGKSSLTGVLTNLLTDLGVIIDVDKIAAANDGNNVLAGRIAIKKQTDCLNRGICFTQETTLSGHRTSHTARKAKECGYYIRMYYVGLNSAEESIQRIANRVKNGGHNIPSEDVYRRYANRVQSLAAVLPYCDEVHFYDNHNGFVEVGEYRNGSIIPYHNAPQWLLTIADTIND